jgi:hypothetical protein
MTVRTCTASRVILLVISNGWLSIHCLVYFRCSYDADVVWSTTFVFASDRDWIYQRSLLGLVTVYATLEGSRRLAPDVQYV